jgi:amino acid adenylation domain-containing protein
LPILGHHFAAGVSQVQNASASGLGLVGPDGKELVGAEFNRTDHEFPAGRCLPGLLREQASARPGRVAVVCGRRRLTFRGLLNRSTDLGRYLRHLGVAPDDRVGLFVEPSLDLMVGAWGILSAGAGYLPLAPEYPAERLSYMIETSGARVVFTQQRLAATAAALTPPGTAVVTWEMAAEFARTRPADADQPADQPPEELRPHHLAYVIFTSGSTGRPKGVMIEHRSIVNQLHWLQDAYRLDHRRTVLQKTPMSFDAAQWELLAPACGSTVVIAGPGEHRDPAAMIDTIRRHAVTTLQCVPTLLQALLDTEELSSCRSLRQVFSGGEALSTKLARACLQVLPEDCELVNLYGPTECTINSSAHTVDREALDDGPGTVPIGAPVYNTRYYIVNADRAPAAVGEIGELYISGVQLARGYLGRPDLTTDRFIGNPFPADHRHARLYRTSDLAYWNADGTVQFVGRVDNQVKLRGFRIELDEVKLAVEAHDWVRNAAVVVTRDRQTDFQNLVAFVELNPKEAALMDQGNHGAHHQSKQSRLQLKAQLSDPGLRDAAQLAGRAVVELPGRTPTPRQRRLAFARKTYRFFEGGPVTAADILRVLRRRPAGTGRRSVRQVGLGELGEILRYFGQYRSGDRLLPKYGYASPGSLYATQLYLELDGIGELVPGHYYYHPVHHQLVLVRAKAGAGAARIRVHLIGKRSAIEPVYRNNIREVLQLEAGHLVGLFEEILPWHGLGIASRAPQPAVRSDVEAAAEDYYLGTFEIVPGGWPQPAEPLSVYVQAHPGKVADLPAGLYEHTTAGLRRIADEIVRRKDVIAINQQVYARSSFGITLVAEPGSGWAGYTALGRALQRMQHNGDNLGFMSSGYSSLTGNDLLSAGRIDAVLGAVGRRAGPSYFAVGGPVSDAQVRSEGMHEDSVHMKGPAELIRDDLSGVLPHYMMPNKVVVLDALPLTPNGKVDHCALEASDQAGTGRTERPFVPPRTTTEARIAAVWQRDLRREAVSVLDDFFECGGNSLVAVGLINTLNREFGSALPLQVLFEAPSIQHLARRIEAGHPPAGSRLVRLRSADDRPGIYCWPGLGGYAMNLRVLAGRLDLDRPFYGVQAHGINAGEVPYPTIREMAAADADLITRHQPRGPYTLWGYSFGARVAFETAYQLEQAGEEVEHLFLVAPGSPKLQTRPTGGTDPYRDAAFVTILYSVFAGTITGPEVAECLQATTDEASFTAFVGTRFGSLGPDQVRRIARVVRQTYSFHYTFDELAERTVGAPVTIFKASGDDYSFLENASGYSARPPTVVDLAADHYGLLREPAVGELAQAVHSRLGA